MPSPSVRRRNCFRIITVTITITEQNNSPYAGWFGKPQGDVLF
ncbi:hypothetical protein [Bifidobacterium crudilactis]|nr:hypothetical protein [Bifidobacterium crudilactis]